MNVRKVAEDAVGATRRTAERAAGTGVEGAKNAAVAVAKVVVEGGKAALQHPVVQGMARKGRNLAVEGGMQALRHPVVQEVMLTGVEVVTPTGAAILKKKLPAAKTAPATAQAPVGKSPAKRATAKAPSDKLAARKAPARTAPAKKAAAETAGAADQQTDGRS